MAEGDETPMVLSDGKVLLMRNQCSVLFDPRTRTWARAAINPESADYSATLLPHDRVLVAGGQNKICGTAPTLGTYCPATANAAIYDLHTGQRIPIHRMLHAKLGQSTLLLADGTVLMLGGSTGSGADTPDVQPVSTAEIYHPRTDMWTPTMFPPQPVITWLLLPNGKVFAVATDDRAEMYDSGTGHWILGRRMLTPRTNFALSLLPAGRILVSGGNDVRVINRIAAQNPPDFNAVVPDLATAEIYDPASDRWTATTPMHTARAQALANLLPNGQVLVAGGECCDDTTGKPIATAELYDPQTQQWTWTSSMNRARASAIVVSLPNQQVLVVGGCCDAKGHPLTSTEIYAPSLQRRPRPHILA